jgi:Subtilase family.
VIAQHPDGTFKSIAGTSFAAPRLAGLLALEMVANPDLTADQAAQQLSDKGSPLD